MTEDSFSIMRKYFSNQEEPTLSHVDAARFVESHFPIESSRLRGNMSKYQLLERATKFSYHNKYIGDIKEQCSAQWLVFLNFIFFHLILPPDMMQIIASATS